MEGMLKISEAANLAIHAMVYMLRARDGATISVAEIAGILDVSRDHLGKVLQRLNHMGLVTSKRGPKGGFALRRDPAKVTLLQVIEAVDGPLPRNHCLLGRPICGEDACILGDLMRNIHAQVNSYLSGTTLADMDKISPLANPGAKLKGRNPARAKRRPPTGR